MGVVCMCVGVGWSVGRCVFRASRGQGQALDARRERTVDELLLELGPLEVEDVGHHRVEDELVVRRQLCAGEGGDAVQQQLRRLW